MKGRSKKPIKQGKISNGSVFLYVPNIIGYFRVALIILGIFVAYSNYLLLTILYASSQILDALDGWTARKLKQESKFGAVFDQIIDRISTIYLYILNCQVYKNYTPIIIIALTVDVGGHWIHTFGAASSSRSTHKIIPENWFLLKLYYEKKAIMISCIVGYESFWLSTFLLSQNLDPASFLYLYARSSIILGIPFVLFKLYTNIGQGLFGAIELSKLEF